MTASHPTDGHETPEERARYEASEARLPMEFRLGAVVANRRIPGNFPFEPLLGHVTGFDRNILGEVVIVVAWCDGTTYPVHHSGLILDPTDWPPAWSEEEALRRQRAAEAARQD